ncbi:MAG: NAD(P)H-dependent oxidoreductase [Pseudomonadales bacterium]|nr:NAD(P)H-dependent oxidoreductase [Pseudomonadales bacterium]MDG1938658.1 NAD(P)H-dependent oxidoreductase [Pseudomonadales bacterium]MDG2035642.1 NAD(P)H-dependent oxidoreductase [Pseudomonadales bacterium]
MEKKKLLVIYHSQSENTAQLVEAVAAGAALEPQIELSVKRAFDADTEDLKWADAILFGTPENFGYMSGALKDFFDRTYYPAQPLQLCTPYALFVSAGNDGSGAVREIDRILKGYPMKKVAEPLVIKGKVDADALEACRDLGQTMASALQLGVF